MKQPFKTERYKRLLQHFLLAVAVIVAYKIISATGVVVDMIKQMLNIISPFIYGFILAYVLNIICGVLENQLAKIKNDFIHRKKKIISIACTYLLSFLLLLLILRLIIPSIYNSISYFIMNLQTYYDSGQKLIDYLNNIDILSFDLSMGTIMTSIQEFGLALLPSSVNAIFGVSSAILKGFLTIVSSVYILYEKENFKAYLSRLFRVFLPDAVYDGLIRYTGDLNRNFKKYLYTQTIDGCIMGTVVAVELYLLGSPFALILGIMIGFVNYIPYFGSIIGTLSAIAVVAFTQGVQAAVLAAIILLITQQIDGNIIQPKLMGGSFALSPLLIIITITIGGAYGGIFGMIAAIPIIAVLKDILGSIVIYYERKKTNSKNT